MRGVSSSSVPSPFQAMLMQVVYKEQQDAWQAQSAAAQEIDEMHALLLGHHQRIPTVDTVQSLLMSISNIKHSPSLMKHMTAESSKTASTYSSCFHAQREMLHCRFSKMTSKRPWTILPLR